MLEDALHRLRGLPARTRVLLAVGVVAMIALVLLLAMRSDPADLGVADSGAGNEQALPPQAQPATPDQLPQPATPDGAVVADPVTPNGNGVAPINAGSAGGGDVATPQDTALENEMNATLPQKQQEPTPDEIAGKAPPDVKYAGQVLTLWSTAMKRCLTDGKVSVLDCIAASDKAAPGVSYQNGTLAGDLATEVEYKIYRTTPDGTKVWLFYNHGTECHGYGDNFAKCSAW